METVEIIVFIVFAFMVGFLILGVVTGWDFGKYNEGLKKVFSGGEGGDFKKTSKEEFAAEVYSFFQECKDKGTNISTSFYLKEEGSFSKQELFQVYKGFGWCKSIQSLENECGQREDVTMQDLQLPRVVRLECRDEHLTIS
ncbi:hypothetical protein KY348_00225 [Candidatus Woesearchaeota archaeon]|nr:hypothetical protein [Candidatus Woesearchaeota archaeon]